MKEEILTETMRILFSMMFAWGLFGLGTCLFDYRLDYFQFIAIVLLSRMYLFTEPKYYK